MNKLSLWDIIRLAVTKEQAPIRYHYCEKHESTTSCYPDVGQELSCQACDEEYTSLPPKKQKINRRVGGFGKYYHCACGWYISIIANAHTAYPTAINGTMGGQPTSYTLLPAYYPTTIDQFKANECCPKCGVHSTKIPIQTGRPIYKSITFTDYKRFTKEELKGGYRYGGFPITEEQRKRNYYESIWHGGENLERMEWLSDEPLLLDNMDKLC